MNSDSTFANHIGHRLHLGCGGVALPGWRNIDSDCHPGIEQHDLRTGIPAGDDSVDEIFSSHLLEHMRVRHEAAPFIRECYRVLRPGGVMTHVTPNFEEIVSAYSRMSTLRLASGVFGDGRTPWDYHVSGWWPRRWHDLVRTGSVITPGGNWEALPLGADIVSIANVWRPHSGYELVASIRKPGPNPVWPTAPAAHEIAPEGWYRPVFWALRHLSHRDATVYFPWPIRVFLLLPPVRVVVQAASIALFRPVDIQAVLAGK